MTKNRLSAGDGASDRSELLTLYQVTFETLRHEGNGIWERFNILVGFNLALFAAVGLLCLSDGRPSLWRGFGIAISLAGALTAIWSVYVLQRLWDRHWHWRETLQKIEQKFPANWPQALDEPRKCRVTLTGPFLLLFFVAWVGLFVVLAVCPSAFSPT